MQIIYWESNLLVPVACFAKLVEIGLRAFWAEHRAPYTQCLTKELNVPRLGNSQGNTNSYTYIHTVTLFQMSRQKKALKSKTETLHTDLE